MSHKSNKEKNQQADFLKKIRKALFWDTDIRLIDPEKHDKAIIRRVFTRGNEAEKKLVADYYGQERVKYVLRTLTVFI